MDYKAILISIMIISYSWAVAQEDKCSDILKAGFYNTTNITNSGNFTSDVNSWLISDSFMNYIRSRGDDFKLSIPIKGVPLSIGHNTNSEQFKQFKNSFSQGGTVYNNSSFSNHIALQVVSESVVKEWGECMKVGKKGLVSFIEGDDDDFFLYVKWNPAFGVNSVTLANIYIKGAEFDKKNLYEGKVIRTEYVSIPIHRVNNEKIVISVGTENDIGSISFVIDSKEVNTKPTVDQKIKSGDLEIVIRSKSLLDNDINKRISEFPDTVDRFGRSPKATLYQIKALYRQVYYQATKLYDLKISHGVNSSEYSHQLLEYQKQLLYFENSIENENYSEMWEGVKRKL